MTSTPHSPKLRFLTLVAAFAGLLLSGCADGAQPPAASTAPVAEPTTTTRPAVTSTTGPAVTSTTRPVITSTTRPVATSPTAPSLDDIDRALADLDTLLTDVDHDVATPEGDIR